jgi:hypothetical protein
MSKPSLRIRFSQAADTGKIADFYKDNSHAHVDQRQAELLRSRIESGCVFMVEDETGKLGMASVSYEFNRKAGEPPVWTEIGSTRSVLAGVGLYPFVVASQVVHEFLTRTPEDSFFAGVYKDNQPVTDLLSKKVGWSIYNPPAEMAKITDLEKDLAKLNCMESASRNIPQQARLVLEYIERGTKEGLMNKKTGARVKLDLSEFPLANELRPLLEELAHGAFGKQLETEPRAPLGETRKRFEAYLSQKP